MFQVRGRIEADYMLLALVLHLALALQQPNAAQIAASRSKISWRSHAVAPNEQNRQRHQLHPKAPDVGDGPQRRVPQFDSALDGEAVSAGGRGKKLLAILRTADERARAAATQASADAEWRAWVADAIDESIDEYMAFASMLQEAATDYAPDLLFAEDSDGLMKKARARFSPMALALYVRRRVTRPDGGAEDSEKLVVSPSHRFAVWTVFRARLIARLREPQPAAEGETPVILRRDGTQWFLLRRLHSAAVNEERQQQRRRRLRV